MKGHHLILGELVDFITGETIRDTHDERYRQKLARLLVELKGYSKKEIKPRRELRVSAGEKNAMIKIDFEINVSGKIDMIIKYGPGSLITRHRPALAASRLVAPYQIPIVVVTNGEDADAQRAKIYISVGVLIAYPQISKRFKFTYTIISGSQNGSWLIPVRPRHRSARR